MTSSAENPHQTSTIPATVDPSLNARIQKVLDDYRPTLYMDGGDVELLKVDENGIAHVKMLGACIDCPISLLTMKLGIQRLLKENFSEITGINAITDIDISALYDQSRRGLPGSGQ
jgi:Fe-S cluster biogenesis protein NfuA